MRRGLFGGASLGESLLELGIAHAPAARGGILRELRGDVVETGLGDTEEGVDRLEPAEEGVALDASLGDGELLEGRSEVYDHHIGQRADEWYGQTPAPVGAAGDLRERLARRGEVRVGASCTTRESQELVRGVPAFDRCWRMSYCVHFGITTR